MSKINNINFKPLGARVLVERNQEGSISNDITEIEGMVIDNTKLSQIGSLYIPETIEKQENIEYSKNTGKILVLGTGLSEDAKNNLQVGGKITFQNPHEIRYNGVDYYLIHENNIELILEEDTPSK